LFEMIEKRRKHYFKEFVVPFWCLFKAYKGIVSKSLKMSLSKFSGHFLIHKKI
jgi:hypothetical protein